MERKEEEKKKNNRRVSIMQRATRSRSRWGQVGTDPTPTPTLVCGSGAPTTTLCALRPLCSGHMTHSTIEWDAPSFAYTHKFWGKKKKSEALVGASCTCSVVGHLWALVCFVFLSNWEINEQGRNMRRDKQWCSLCSSDGTVTWKSACYRVGIRRHKGKPFVLPLPDRLRN